METIDNADPLSFCSNAECSPANDSGFPPSINLDARCPLFEETGECRHGFKCRFLGAHIRKTEDGRLELIKDDDKVARTKIEVTELNYLSLDAMKLIRGKKVGCGAPFRKPSFN